MLWNAAYNICLNAEYSQYMPFKIKRNVWFDCFHIEFLPVPFHPTIFTYTCTHLFMLRPQLFATLQFNTNKYVRHTRHRSSFTLSVATGYMKAPLYTYNIHCIGTFKMSWRLPFRAFIFSHKTTQKEASLFSFECFIIQWECNINLEAQAHQTHCRLLSLSMSRQ